VLEARYVIAALEHLASRPRPATILDVGCGDGRTILAVAERYPSMILHGVDFSEEMIRQANEGLAQKGEAIRSRIRFEVADARSLSLTFGDIRFDAVCTDRCLINLTAAGDQQAAIGEIARVLRPDGLFFAIENFVEGQERLNRERKAIGLTEIQVRWHNKFFTHEEFSRLIKESFEEKEIIHFSSAYYYATRIIYSKLCSLRGDEPDYDHDIHRLAVDLPPHGEFSPIQIVVARRRSGE
jgi:ubiquinone/menaquinone biosynthesis C-methylase UbiE